MIVPDEGRCATHFTMKPDSAYGSPVSVWRVSFSVTKPPLRLLRQLGLLTTYLVSNIRKSSQYKERGTENWSSSKKSRLCCDQLRSTKACQILFYIRSFWYAFERMSFAGWNCRASSRLANRIQAVYLQHLCC